MAIQFFIAMSPPTITHQEKRCRVVNGKPQFYEPQEIATVRDMFCGKLMPHRPDEPMTGAVRLVTKWCFPKGKHRNGYKTTKPDTDNMIKLFKDCMTFCGYWYDDAQVASEITEKFWHDVPGIFVRVEMIEED